MFKKGFFFLPLYDICVIIEFGGDPMKKCLIVVDYQNDFINGALGFAGGLKIKQVIIDKIKSAISENIDIIFTKDTHNQDYLQSEEGKNLPVIHCIKGTWGHDFPEEIKALVQAYKNHIHVVEKPSFPSIDLGIYLREKQYDWVELCGLVSYICLLSNAVIAKGALPNAHIVVDALATAALDQDLHRKALDILKGLHIEVTNDVQGK